MLKLTTDKHEASRGRAVSLRQLSFLLLYVAAVQLLIEDCGLHSHNFADYTHSDLRVLLTNAVLVHRTTELYFWVYRCCFQLDAITQAPAHHY